MKSTFLNLGKQLSILEWSQISAEVGVSVKNVSFKLFRFEIKKKICNKNLHCLWDPSHEIVFQETATSCQVSKAQLAQRCCWRADAISWYRPHKMNQNEWLLVSGVDVSPIQRSLSAVGRLCSHFFSNMFLPWPPSSCTILAIDGPRWYWLLEAEVSQKTKSLARLSVINLVGGWWYSVATLKYFLWTSHGISPFICWLIRSKYFLTSMLGPMFYFKKHSILTGTSMRKSWIDICILQMGLCCQQMPWSQAGLWKHAILVESLHIIYWLIQIQDNMIWYIRLCDSVHCINYTFVHVLFSYAAQVCFEKWRPLENRTGWVWGLVLIWIAVVH